MGLVQKGPFFHLLILGNVDRKNVSYDILERTIAFLGYQIKNLISKSWKFEVCPEGFVHGFGPKLIIFPSKIGHFFHRFILGNIGQGNVFYDILDRKNAFPSYKNKKFKKWKNCEFSKPVSPWFWSKIGHFVHLFLLGNIGQENVFYDILERENAFLGCKSKKFKN